VVGSEHSLADGATGVRSFAAFADAVDQPMTLVEQLPASGAVPVGGADQLAEAEALNEVWEWMRTGMFRLVSDSRKQFPCLSGTRSHVPREMASARAGVES
jgi:hypothetical protein